jgi:hypothetical protein
MSVRQIGRGIVVGAVLPRERTDGTPLAAGIEVRVLRLRETASLRPGAVSKRYLVAQFSRQAEVVATFTGKALERAAPGGRFLHSDGGAFDAVVPSGSISYLYSLALIDAEGKSSPMPVPIAIEIRSPPPVPVDLSAATAEGEVRLTWRPGGAAGEPASDVTFNIYRGAAGDARDPETALNPEPLSEPSYIDTTFSYGTDYSYFVRSSGEAVGPLHESDSCQPVTILPLDRFPPATPTGLAAAAEGKVIKLYWFPNSEPDLAGYRIYRREGQRREPQPAPEEEGGAAEGQESATEGGTDEPEQLPDLVGEVGAGGTSWMDEAVVPDVRYHYSVAAIDGASPPNESPRSEEQSEMVSGEAPRPAPGDEGSPGPDAGSATTTPPGERSE